MTVITLSAVAGPDGVPTITIPVGAPGEYEVTVRPMPAAGPTPTPEDLGWPPGYFERTAGSLPDFSVEPRDQGEYEDREEF